MHTTPVDIDVTLFKKILLEIRKDKRLLIFSACNFLFTICVLIGITEPLIRYEKHQWAIHHNVTFAFVRIYLALLFFLYIKNIIKGLFNTAICIAIKQKYTQKQWSFHSVWGEFRRSFIRIIIYYTYFSFLGIYYLIYSACIGFNHKRRVFGGTHMQYAHFICTPCMLNQPGGPRHILKRSGQLITKAWGKPPLKMHFNMITIQWLLFIACLLPSIIVLSTASQLNWLVYAGLALSLILFFCLDITHKIVWQYFSYALYHYAKTNQVLPPFPASTFPLIFTKVLTEESD